MRVQINLRDWATHVLGQDHPGLQAGWLDSSPVTDLDPHSLVYDALSAGLARVTKEDPKALGPDEVDQLLNPFRRTFDFWVLGSPVDVYVEGRQVHFIDSLEEVFPNQAESSLLTAKPRQAYYTHRHLLGNAGANFVDAVALQDILHVATKLVVEDHLGPVEDYLVDSNATLATARSNLPPALLEVLKSSTISIVLQRIEAAIYSDFCLICGSEYVQHGLIPFIYPSRLWQKIEEGEGPVLLSEIGSRISRYDQIQNRLRKTEAVLAEDKDLTELGWLSLGRSQFLKSNEIVRWWLRKETVALRYYLIGVLSFPESFLSLLKGEDLPPYRSALANLFGTSLAKEAEAKARDYFPARSEAGNLVGMLRSFLRDRGIDPDSLVHGQIAAVQAALREKLDTMSRVVLTFLFSYLRNALTHGTDFKAHGDGALSFRHGASQGREASYLADYESLSVSFRLLPLVLETIWVSHPNSRVDRV